MTPPPPGDPAPAPVVHGKTVAGAWDLHRVPGAGAHIDLARRGHRVTLEAE